MPAYGYRPSRTNYNTLSVPPKPSARELWRAYVESASGCGSLSCYYSRIQPEKSAHQMIKPEGLSDEAIEAIAKDIAAHSDLDRDLQELTNNPSTKIEEAN